MIELMTYTYLLDVKKIKKELDKLWDEYQKIINKKDPSWKQINKSRAILYLTGQIYCERIAVEAIERRLHLLEEPLTLQKFLNLIDGKHSSVVSKRLDPKFKQLEEFYNVIKAFKNNNLGGKFYLDEEKFIKKHESKNPDKKLKMGYRGKFKE